MHRLPEFRFGSLSHLRKKWQIIDVMKTVTTFLTALLGLVILALPAHAAAQEDEQLIRGDDPVVVELFSSQGCGYCPQADEFLAKLVEFDNIIALSCHVDYFDTPYWGDPLSLPLCSQRQQAYVQKFKNGPVYTPQMIINGDLTAVGYHFDEVLQTIRFADSRRMAKPEMQWMTDGKLGITLPESNMASDDTVVWLVQLQEPRYMTIEGGANRGKRIYYVNIIDKLGDVGTWHGKKKTVTVDTGSSEDTYAYAVLLQNEDGIGRIVGAAILEAPKAADTPPTGKDG